MPFSTPTKLGTWFMLLPMAAVTLVGVAGGDRHVPAEPERVELIDPGVVAGLGAARLGHLSELGPGKRIERPALGAVLSRGRRPVEWPLALAPVEAREVSAGERRPGDTVPIDVHTARAVPWNRRLEDFGQRGRRRLRSRVQSNDVAGKAEQRATERSIDRADPDAVKGRGHPPVLR